MSTETPDPGTPLKSKAALHIPEIKLIPQPEQPIWSAFLKDWFKRQQFKPGPNVDPSVEVIYFDHTPGAENPSIFRKGKVIRYNPDEWTDKVADEAPGLILSENTYYTIVFFKFLQRIWADIPMDYSGLVAFDTWEETYVVRGFVSKAAELLKEFAVQINENGKGHDYGLMVASTEDKQYRIIIDYKEYKETLLKLVTFMEETALDPGMCVEFAL
jgi:hypothetical protein